ncbi:MAG: NAD kinase [Alphaproteobacteria bacterium]
MIPCFFTAAPTPQAEEALRWLQQFYGQSPLEKAAVIVALGGDGFMLQTLHRYLNLNLPVYGMNCGTVGFLMNPYHQDNLHTQLEHAISLTLYPLEMTAENKNSDPIHALAINEVSLLRETRQACKLSISIDQTTRLTELVCDGVMVATPSGSTAYNLSVNGPILPLTANILALTPISPFRPRRWRGALLPDHTIINIDVLESDKRKTSAVADHIEVRDVTRVQIKQSNSHSFKLMFAPDHSLEERIMKEQFLP